VLSVGDSRIFKVLIGASINRTTALEAEGVEAICLRYELHDDLLSVGHFDIVNDWRWNAYDQLAEDVPFEYWMKQAAAELEYLRGAR